MEASQIREGAMAELSFINTPDLRCPYCGHQIRPDTDWVIAARQAWGWCGVQARCGEEVVGVLLLTPAEAAGHALVKSLWVATPQRGTGRRLVQSACAGLLNRQVRAIVSPAATTQVTCQLPPRAFLRHAGFIRPLDEPLYRLDLDSTVSEKSSARNVVKRLMASLRPASPEPAGRMADS
jgi:hypothetical protein